MGQRAECVKWERLRGHVQKAPELKPRLSSCQGPHLSPPPLCGVSQGDCTSNIVPLLGKFQKELPKATPHLRPPKGPLRNLGEVGHWKMKSQPPVIRKVQRWHVLPWGS